MPDLAIDGNSPVPRYIQIHEQLRVLIETGKLRTGEQLPTEAELREQLGVSRMTVRQALAELVKDGLIYRRRAKGSFVARSRREVPFAADGLRSFTEEAEAYGQRLETRVLTQDVVPAAGRAAQQLHVPPGTRVVVLRRLRVVDGEPIATEVSHFPYDRFPLLASADLTNRSVYHLLEDHYGSLPQEAVDSFAAGPPTVAEAKALGLDAAAPVWHFQRTAYDGNGCAVEYTEATFRLDRFRYTTHRRRVQAELPGASMMRGGRGQE
jgi:GntR family transcriptional regulator